MQLTPSQAGAVNHRGSDLLVAASAGSGKTEVLARRVVALLADPERPAELSELAIVTFTRAAAAELRVRVARMLRAAQAAATEARLRHHLRRQEVLVGAAEIGTIDAWCGRIVREHFDLAGIDAQFSVLAEEDAALLRREVRDALFDWVYAADDPAAAAARAWIGRHRQPSDEFLRTLVGELNRYREHLIDPEPWLAAQRAQFSDSGEEIRAAARVRIAAALRADCEFLSGEFATLHTDEECPNVRGDIGALRVKLQRAHAALADPARLEQVTMLLAERLPVRRGFSEDETAASDRVRKWFKKRIAERYEAGAIRDLLDTAPDAARLALVLLDLEARYEQCLQAEKRRRGAYEFADVLRLALDLLGEPDPAGPRRPTPLAERLRRRYAHILVDEFQDTSPVQVEIVRLLSRSDPGTTNRFLVGDVKQSIYGFRQAEPRLFAKLRDELDSGAREGRVQPLADNFRSHGHVLDVLNGLFERLFDPHLGGSRYGEHERLVARRTEIDNPSLDARPRVHATLLEPPPRGPAAEDSDEEDEDALLERVEREALVAAEQILALRRQGVQVPERRGDGVALRPLRFGDIVILLRAARKNAGLIAGVLRRRGIPVVTSGRDSLLDTQESRDLTSVLLLLANRRQDIPLAAYLRSPFVGLTDAELLDLRRGAKTRDLHDAAAHVLESDPARPWLQKLRDGWRQLDDWSEAARELELPALLQRILFDGAYPLFVRGLPGGGHRVAVVQAIQQFAAQFASGGQRGVAEFVQFLEGLEESDVEPSVAVTAGEDVVRIMTIHAAKGLEFPIVFLLNAGADFRSRGQPNGLRLDAEGGLGLKFEDYPSLRTLTTPAYTLLSEPQRTRELEEELRLLYVALTRAREHLHIVGHHAADEWAALQQRGGRPLLLLERLGAASMLEWVLLAAAAGDLHDAARPAGPRIAVRCNARPEPSPAAPDPPPAPPPQDAADRAWVERAERLLAAPIGDALSRTPAVLSVSALKEQALRDPAAPRLIPAEKFPPQLAPPAFARGAARDTTDIGTATHRFLQLADLARLTDAAAIGALAEELRAAQRLSADEVALLPLDDLAWLAATPEGALLRTAADGALRELPFTQAVPAAAADPRRETAEFQIVRGVIDCLIPRPPGYILLDYKTDRVAPGPALDERTRIYTVQLQQYARAAAAALNAPIIDARLIFLHARRVISIPLPA